MNEYLCKLLILGLLLGVTIHNPGLSAEPLAAQATPDSGDVPKSPGPAYARASTANAWNMSVLGDSRPDDDPWSGSRLSFRIYGGRLANGPALGRRLPAYGIDVNAQFEKCVDGDMQISALDIGGLLYAPPRNCAATYWPETVIGNDASRAIKGAEQSESDPEQTPSKQTVDDGSIHCEPAGWSCQKIGH